MNWEIVIVAIIAASPGVWSLIQNRKKGLAEVGLVTAQVKVAEAQAKATEAQEDNLRADTQNKIIAALQSEACELRKKQETLDARLIVAETRAATAEARAATAEGRALDYERLFTSARTDIVRFGEEIHDERRENQSRFNKLALLVSRLIEQVKSLGATPEISSEEVGILDKLVVVGG